MINVKIKNQFGYFSLFFVFCLVVILAGCQSEKKDQNSFAENDFTDQLAAGADIETIADHLIQVRQKVGVSSALVLQFPNLKLEKAIQIQMAMLSKLEQQGERVVGWKMGGANKDDFNPGFGFMLASNEFQSGSTVSSSEFADRSPLIEAEIGFVMKSDLPGPVTTRDELISAIESVGGFSELISNRTKGGKDGAAPAFAHFMADGLSHGGFIQPQRKYPLDEVDFNNENGRIEINGKVISEGNSNALVFIDAVLYLANILPKYGRYLHAGDIIITGSILESPPAKAGDQVEIVFSDFDSLNINFE